jgi:hypothetical protein
LPFESLALKFAWLTTPQKRRVARQLDVLTLFDRDDLAAREALHTEGF